MSKQQTNKPASPAELISKAEADIARLEHEREAHVARGAELAERRKAASYGAHVQHDPESRKQLDAVNAEIGMHASELQSFDDALATARTKLAEAQQAQAQSSARPRSRSSRSSPRNFAKLVRSWIGRPTTCGAACWRSSRTQRAWARIIATSPRCTAACRSRSSARRCRNTSACPIAMTDATFPALAA